MPRLALALSVLAVAGACAKGSDAPRAVPSASASSAPSVSGAASGVPLVLQAKPGCRALLVGGKATVDGTPITAGTLLDGELWVDLEANSFVALRHTLSSRELRLIGPAHVLPCRHGAEQVLLASGELSTSANLGVRPGAEVLIATPSGTVRYGDAALDVEFGVKGLRVRVKQGEAWVEPEKDGKPPFKNPLTRGAEAALPSRPLNAQALVATCQTAARMAEASAEQVLNAPPPGAMSSLGARASAQMRDRKSARTACATAAAAIGASSDPAERLRLSAAVARADELWQSVPRGAASQKN